MGIPVLQFIWQLSTAGLNVAACQQWSEVRAATAPYGLDVDKALHRLTAIPDAENFMAQPFLQACILNAYGQELAELNEFSSKCAAPLKSVTGGLDSGVPPDLLAMRNEIAKKYPRPFRTPVREESDAALAVFQFTEFLGIPWEELTQAARDLPQSQVPPLGTIPEVDGYDPPSAHIASSTGIIRLARLAGLRCVAALARDDHQSARDALLIQGRLVEGLRDRPVLVQALVASGLTQFMVSQIYEGFRRGVWTSPDVEWISSWSVKVDAASLLAEAMKMECVYSVRWIDELRRDPEMDEKIYNRLYQGALGESLKAGLDGPFGRECLKFMLGHTALLYRATPAAGYVLWSAAEIRKNLEQHLKPLKSGGLRRYAWPEKETRKESGFISYARLGANMAASQSKLNMVRTACALHSWQAGMGDLPNVLEALQPELPAAACQDICSGMELKYTRLSRAGYQLSSIGADAVDDGAVPLSSEGKGDIVWKISPNPR